MDLGNIAQNRKQKSDSIISAKEEVTMLIKGSSSVHLVGIGGTGMSGLAAYLQWAGLRVSGSDREESRNVASLRNMGVEILVGHHPEMVRGVDFVIRSLAVPETDPEVTEAATHGVPIVTRPEALGEVSRGFPRCIAVAGTHGKTTTTAMIGWALSKMGLGVTCLVGGTVPQFAGPGLFLGSDILVVEACEYMNAFSELFPTTCVVLNVEPDHMEYFHDVTHLRHAFGGFLARLGLLGRNNEGAILNSSASYLSSECPPSTPVTLFGTEGQADVSAQAIELGPSASEYELHIGGLYKGAMQLIVPGKHNILNSLAAISVGRALGLDPLVFGNALRDFRGVARRLELVGHYKGASVVSDYAHHPTEIGATLSALRLHKPKRLICVFQPHLFSRTRLLLDEFATALSQADMVFVMPIYAAREAVDSSVTSDQLADRIIARGTPCQLYSPKSLSAQTDMRGDVIAFLGAGDVDRTARDLARTS
ncbi:MAG: UDP-N-acetylmuramate--L-alanine ligase [Thermoleophilia bacterium]